MSNADGASLGELAKVCRRAYAGRRPARYDDFWREEFDARVRAALKPGMRILDVGSGRRPTVSIEERPADCHYVGLDLSAAEMRRAPAGSYDEMYVSDVRERVAEIENEFDLIVSFQVLEHVKPLDAAMEHMRCYLRPGGRLLTHFSGTFSVFGLLNRMLPSRVSVFLLQHLTGRDPDTVFPAYYDQCWYSAIEPMLGQWSGFEIQPRWRGASYFGFSRLLRAVYITYEEWALRAGHRNLAPYYLVDAIR